MEIANFRKILTAISLTFLISSNLSAVEFDLPANTPGRSVITAPGPTHGHPALVQKTINTAHNVNCEHVIVPNSPAAGAANVNAAMALNGNIYFPENGEQPTEAEAEVLSCATFEENDVNSPITDWYITMFGGSDHTNHNPNLQIGFTTIIGAHLIALAPRPASAAIITMDAASMTAGTRTADFWQDFRRIASSRIGRILLYRILIEIRRQRNIEGTWKAYVSTDVPGIISAANLKRRANCRNITISWDVRGNSFSKDEHTIKYANVNRKLTTICEKMGNNHPISIVERESHIGLFHEMVHWFHVLRHPERHSKERMAFKVPAISLRDTANRETIGGYFWGSIDNNNTNSWKVSATPWLGYSINDSYVNFEEIRTILGAPTLEQYRLVVPNNPFHPNPYIFLNGDDLSENKYRVSVDAKLRFGHSNQPFYEDNSVIQKVIDVSGSAGGNIVNLVDYNALDDGCRPECKIGLGNFRVGGYNIGGMIP